ncbi:hypothetical protein ASPBRDRAFT_139782, partial [Aspergillus brasiliensis CBS 101740]
IAVILCLTVYIITAFCLLKFRGVASGTLDLSSPAADPEQPMWDSSRRLKSLNRVAPLERYGTWYASSVYHDRIPSLNVEWESSTCTICLDLVRRADTIHALPCKHVFHRRCLENWFLRHHITCPICCRVFYV